MRRLLPVLLLLSLVVPALASEKESELKFTVVKGDTGKPIKNASVILHPVNKKGKQSHGGLQLKTDIDGNASYAGVPYGKLRVQVIAPGYQTFGDDYEVATPTQEITIKLSRPKEQYSIYK